MTAAPGDLQPKSEDLVAHPSHTPPIANPFAHSANITISVPETVEVRLVDASALADYEVWVFLSSILASAVTGFLVALVQSPSPESGRYAMITIVFAALMVVCGITGILKRKKLSSKTRRIRFRVGEQLPDA